MKQKMILYFFVFFTFFNLYGSEIYKNKEIGGSVENLIFYYGGVSYLKNYSAIFINPAGIVDESKSWVYFSHCNWIMDFKMESLNAGYSLNKFFTLGFYMNYFYTTKFSEIDKFGDVVGNINYYEIESGILSSINLKSFNFGINFKFLNRNITENNSSFNIDIGLKIPVILKRLSIGVNIKNMLSGNYKTGNRVERIKLENIYGISYKLSPNFAILFGSNFTSQNSFGLNLKLGKKFETYFGYNLGDRNYWGIGLSYNVGMDKDKRVIDIGFSQITKVKDDFDTILKIGFLYEI